VFDIVILFLIITPI